MEPAPDTSWVKTTCGNCGDGKHWRGYCHPVVTFGGLAMILAMMLLGSVLVVWTALRP
jgi:hypothetical protein